MPRCSMQVHLQSERDLGPAQHGLAVKEFDHRRLDDSRLLVTGHRGRDIASQRSLNATDSADLPGRFAPPIE